MDIISFLHPGVLTIVCAPYAARESVSVLSAELALRGPLTILDGGNRFQPYRVACLLRQKTTDISSAAKRMSIRRAFTCYQMLALLEDTPSLRQPFLVLDLLASFYDEQVAEREAGRLLAACLLQVERLVQFAPVLVTIRPSVTNERAFMIEQVYARAQKVMEQVEPVQQFCQPNLFPLY